MFDDLINEFQRTTSTLLGLLCFVAFLINAGVLVWVLLRQGKSGAARCPRCGRAILCPHCEEDDQKEGAASASGSPPVAGPR